MLSNHYPMTYGSEKNVAILLLLFILGAAARHYKISKEKVGFIPPVLIVLSLLGLAYLTLEKSSEPGDSFSINQPKPAEKTDTGALDLSQASALVVNVNYSGRIPPPQKISATPECRTSDNRPLLTENFVAKNGKLQNVFVWISHGLEDKKFPVPDQEVVMDQRECAYRPRVVGVQVGQPISFLNSDAFLHNVHSLAKVNDRFNVSLANKNQKITRKLMKPEMMLRSKCDIHPWMSGYIGVVDHPYFGVSDQDGIVKLPKLPPGKYVVSVWHETLGQKEEPIEIKAETEAKMNFNYSESDNKK